MRVSPPEIRSEAEGVVSKLPSLWRVARIIAATTMQLFRAAVQTLPQVILFAVGLAVLYLWKSKAAVAVVVLGSALAGLLLR